MSSSLKRRVLLGLAFFPSLLAGQETVAISRADAVSAAVTHGARLAIAQADSLVAAANVLTARAFQNPTVATSYSKATPNYHVSIDQPFDLPWVRRLRLQSALAGGSAAQFRYSLERALVSLEADTTYTQALAGRERSRLSRRNAQDADSLRRMAVTRRDAGDASDLDVELATVTAGQAANTAINDSLSFLSTLFDLQIVMGLTARQVAITLTDSLTVPTVDTMLFAEANTPVARPDSLGISGATASLSVAAAQASLVSAQQAVALERRNLWGTPSITAGFEFGDPSGGEPGVLPTVGIALPFPLFNRNRAPIAMALAEQRRADAQLAQARATSQAEIARARRELEFAHDRIRRDRQLVASANRVAAMSLTAYREGASTLPNVLEARRNARDVLAQYIDDLAVAWIADAELRVLLLTPGSNRLR